MKKKYISYTDEYLKELIDSNHFTLLNNTYLEDLDNDFINEFLTKKIQNISLEISDYPNFRNINPENIIKLRLAIHLGINDVKVNNWCLKLLRYIEINLAKLKENEKSYNRTRENSILIFQQIQALFVEYYIKKNDLIYLNSALKTADLAWIKPTPKTPVPIKELNIIKSRQIEHILKQLTNG